MADQRPFGRFRLPWVTAAPRPAAEPQPPRPAIEIQAPPQPTTTIPQRPFRPGLASVQSPPPEIRVPQRTEPQPFPTTATTQTGVAMVPTFPSKTSSPSRPASQLARTSQSSPPSRRTTQPQQEPPKPGRSLLFSQATQATAEFKPPSEQVQKEKTKREGKEGKASDRTQEEPLRSAITELLTGSGVGSQRRELHSVAIQSEEKEDRKTATTGSQGEHIKTAPKARAKPTESQQKSTNANGEHVPLHKEIRDDISKLIHKLGAGKLKHPIDEKPVTIVTIAGQNTGASMRVDAEPASKDGSIHIYRGYKLNPDDSTDTTTDGEGSLKGKRSKNKTKEDQVTKAFVNSNAQSVNNSIIFDSSVNEKSPGVHLDLCHSLEEQNPPTDKAEHLETHKAEFSVTPAEKFTYEPSIRRRCLRGLFLEPSDSDNDNPDKPRRHGCRYACGEKSSDKDVGVF